METSEAVDEIDGMTTTELRASLREFVALTMRLGDVSDSESRVTILRMLSGHENDASVMTIDLRAMVVRTLDERDELRRRITRAVERLERTANGRSSTAAILRGEQ